MVRLIIDRPFNLLTGKGKPIPFKAGEQVVPDELAVHWYVISNSHRPEAVAEAEAMDVEGEPEVDGNGEPAGSGAPDSPDDDVPPAPADEPPADDRAVLVAEAEAMGLTIDKRWGIDRIKAAIDAAKG